MSDVNESFRLRRVIEIPIQGQIVEIPRDSLPPAKEIIQLLDGEDIPQHIFNQFAVSYFEGGRLQELLSESVLIKGLCTAASDNLSAILSAKDARERDTIARQSFSYLDAVIAGDPTSSHAYYVRGLLHLVKGDPQNAAASFTSTLQQNPDDKASLFGRCCAQYHMGKYEEAKQGLKQCIKTWPDCPNEVRVALGIVHLALGNTELARAWFKRSLEVDPHQSSALSGMGCIGYDAITTKEEMQAAVDYFAKAYKSDPHNACATNVLAEHFLYRKQYDKVDALTRAALSIGVLAPQRSRAAYLRGCARQAQEAWAEALELFAAAESADSANFLALFNSAQVLLRVGRKDEAAAALHKVLANPVSVRMPEAQRLLGALLAASADRPKDRIQASELLGKAVKAMPNDISTWAIRAQLQEGSDLSEALVLYTTALTTSRGAHVDPQPQLVTNAGTANHLRARGLEGEEAAQLFAKAEKLYLEALALFGSSTEKVTTRGVTTLYNYAVLCRDTHRDSLSAKCHKLILTEHPNYIDSYLQLGSMKKERGDILGAGYWFRLASTRQREHVGALLMYAQLLYQQANWKEGQAALDQALKIERDETYALCEYGNLYHRVFQQYRDTRNHTQRVVDYQMKELKAITKVGGPAANITKDIRENQAKVKHAQKYVSAMFDHSFQTYSRALLKNPKNAFAASGLALLLAEADLTNESQHILSKVAEVARDSLSVSLNASHVFVMTGSFNRALAGYHRVLQKRKRVDAQVMMYLANAMMQAGRVRDCSRYARAAVHLRPWDMAIRFSHAASIYKRASGVLESLGQAESVESIRSCPSRDDLDRRFGEMEIVAKILSGLRGLPLSGTRSHEDSIPFFPFLAKKIAKQCADIMLKRPRITELVVQVRAARATALEAAQEEIDIARRERDAEIERKRQKEVEEEKARLEHAQKVSENLRDLKRKWEEAPAAAAAGGGGGGASAKKRRRPARDQQLEELTDEQRAAAMGLFGADVLSDTEEQDAETSRGAALADLARKRQLAEDGAADKDKEGEDKQDKDEAKAADDESEAKEGSKTIRVAKGNEDMDVDI